MVMPLPALVSVLPTAPTIVTSRPSRIHTVPRPMSTIQCHCDQGKRSSRPGTVVSTTPSDGAWVVVLNAMATSPPLAVTAPVGRTPWAPPSVLGDSVPRARRRLTPSSPPVRKGRAGPRGERSNRAPARRRGGRGARATRDGGRPADGEVAHRWAEPVGRRRRRPRRRPGGRPSSPVVAVGVAGRGPFPANDRSAVGCRRRLVIKNTCVGPDEPYNGVTDPPPCPGRGADGRLRASSREARQAGPRVRVEQFPQVRGGKGDAGTSPWPVPA